MAAPSLSSLFEFGISILNTIVDATTKTILATTGDVESETPGADNVQWLQHVGFVSRPSKPAARERAAKGLVIKRGDHDVCIGSSDIRGQELSGNLGHGDTCIYAAGEDGTGQARVLLKGSTGAVSLYTTADNTSTGAGMGVFINPSDDSVSIINSQGFGLLIKSDGVYLSARDSGLTLLASGDCKLVGKGAAQLDGASVCIGSVAVPGVNSALTGVTGVAGKASVKVCIE